jgi:hypothetical protein
VIRRLVTELNGSSLLLAVLSEIGVKFKFIVYVGKSNLVVRVI